MTKKRPIEHHQLGQYFADTLRALAHDVLSYCPSAGQEFLAHLEELERKRAGDFHILCLVDLPKIGKLFDAALSQKKDLTVPNNLLLFEDLKSVHVPHWVYDTIPFVDAVFCEDGGFNSTAFNCDWELDPNLVFMVRQSLTMFKKFAIPCPSDAVVEAAREFWEIDQNLRAPRSILLSDFQEVTSGALVEGVSSNDCKILFRLVSAMDKLCLRLAPGADLDVNDLLPGHGPGSVSDLPRSGDKYTFPNYPQVIEETMLQQYFTAVNWRVADEPKLCEFKSAAKLVAVPKTYLTPRLIASEPVVHQFLQQGLMKWIRANLCATHKATIDFTDQSKSRDAALTASRNGRLATVDLSAASDRLSVWVVESFFRDRPFLLDALLRTRSCEVHDPIFLQGSKSIRKFAPMGSAVTFPVQSMIYATACIAAGLVWDGNDKKPLTPRLLRKYSDKIRVFGDDLILPKQHLPYLTLLLQYLELKVNSSKTHYLGDFRESCGMDAYRGYEVTPAYVSYTVPTRPGDVLFAYMEQSNNAHRKGLWHLSAWMLGQLEAEWLPLIPVSDEDLGVCSAYTFVRGTYSKRCRKSKHLHRNEVRGFTLKPRIVVKKRETQADLLQYFTEAPEPTSKWTAGHRISKVSGKSGARDKPDLAWVDARAAML